MLQSPAHWELGRSSRPAPREQPAFPELEPQLRAAQLAQAPELSRPEPELKLAQAQLGAEPALRLAGPALLRVLLQWVEARPDEPEAQLLPSVA